MSKLARKPSLFILSFLLFHLLLFLMRHENRVFWYMITGIFLLTSFSYIRYSRHLASRRISQSIAAGLIAVILIVLFYTVAAQYIPDISYNKVMKTLITSGVHYRWQLMISLAVTIPLHELYFRTMLQETIPHPLVAVVLTSVASVSLFYWALSPAQLLAMFIMQLILAASFQFTRRLITPIIGQIGSVIALILLFT
ncbi:CPBP family intramembrane metalloprotease [Macrococcus hajekii]|uniref:CPBP family intramembrane metalloprotease n=1 Tax=Macrococcus hajekii TaxID=198482 RepID=A0A4R6BNF8_9STAP|nr:CPBP family glutamic-type intramembrane protease [Macrococcus hajekii]TDM03393.1 CPBP family intramembrane metalloprotease [Macrococcus hajekii]GGA98474.1 hypothetical protein GCM10007190_03120 [Macrococcus hajekii]